MSKSASRRPTPRDLPADLFGNLPPHQPEATTTPSPESADPELQAFRMLSQPLPAPAPLGLPMGTEALSAPTSAARVKANDLARAVLSSLGALTSKGQAALLAWSGEGGLGGSTSAFYTPSALVKFAWKLATSLGLVGRTLEFSCGSGAFFNEAPEGSLLTGVELDETSSAVARTLFPHAAIHCAPFEQYATQSEDSAFPLIIGNPPYGPRGAAARLDAPQYDSAQWYFVMRGLDRLTPGGYMIAVVPEAMFRNPSEEQLRAELLTKAGVMALCAVPEGAFSASGAGVTTVLMVLRKHDHGVGAALATLTDAERRELLKRAFGSEAEAFWAGRSVFTAQEEGGWSLTSPSLALGATRVAAGRFGNPSYLGDLELDASKFDYVLSWVTAQRHSILTRSALLSAVRHLFGEDRHHAAELGSRRETTHPIRSGSFSRNGQYQFWNGRWKHASVLSEPATLSALNVARAVVTWKRKPSVAAKLSLQRAIDLHLSTHGPFQLEPLQRAAKHFPILAVITAAGGDLSRVLEEVATPPLILSNVLMPDVALELESYGLLDVEQLSKHASVTRESAQFHLLEHYAFTGTTWEHASTYFGGQVLERARAAEQLASDLELDDFHRQVLRRQAERLRALATPMDITEMHLDPRDALLPAGVLERWVNDFLGTHVTIKRNTWDRDGEQVDGVILSRDEWGVTLRLRESFSAPWQLKLRQQVNPAAIASLEAYLNHQTKVEPVRNQDVKTAAQINAERNANQQKAVAFERDAAAHFRRWLLEVEQAPDGEGGDAQEGTEAPESQQRRAERAGFAQLVQDTLNEARYATVPVKAISTPMNLREYRGPAEHPFQSSGVRRTARDQGMIINWEVGLGKTLGSMMLVAQLLQSGRSKLPAIVVELSRLGDFVMNAASALPGLRCEVIGGTPSRDDAGRVLLNEDGEPVMRDDTGTERQAKYAALLTNPPDFVLMTYEAFEALGMLEGHRTLAIKSDPTLMRGLSGVGSFDERNRKMTGHKRLSMQERSLQRHLLRVKCAESNDVPFEALGIDAVIADEGHRFKNVYAAPTVYGESNPKFLGGAESNRALDALHKFRWIRSRGGLTVLMTASWFNNSPLEIFNMLSLVSDGLPRAGITDVSAFITRFVVIEPRLITQPNGDVEYAACVVGFKNLGEMRDLIYPLVIKVTDEDCEMRDGKVGMDLPPLDTIEHLFDLPDEVQELYDAEQLSVDQAEASGDQHLFSIFARLQKLTLHPPLQGVDAPNRRFAMCAQNCLKAREHGGRNLIFMYMGGEEGAAYAALREALVAAGYPEGEIAVLNGQSCPSSAERLRVERAFRRGRFTLLIGSQIMEKGANLQGATDIHHMDYPHHFQAFKQRVGRGRRQGTWVKRIINHLYFARGSFDVMRYQGMLGKRGWAEQLYDPSVNSCANTGLGFSGEEIAVMLARDPDAMRSRIAKRKEERAAASREARLKADLEQIYEYMTSLRLIKERHRQAQARERGPSPQDQASLRRQVTRIRGLHQEYERLCAQAHPMAVIPRLKVPVKWLGGWPVHAGMRATWAGKSGQITQVMGESATLRCDDESTVVLKLAELGELKDVWPTADPQAFGPEPLMTLPESLRTQVTQVDLAAQQEIHAAQLAVQQAAQQVLPGTLSGAQPEPVIQSQMRFGLMVTRQLPAHLHGALYVSGGNGLSPVKAAPEDLQVPLFLIEHRATGAVRQVTVILRDEQAYQRARQAQLQGAKLRARVEELLSSAA